MSWSVKRYLVHRPRPCPVAYPFPCRRPSPCRCLHPHLRHDTHAYAHAHRHAQASPFSSRSPLRPITVIARVPACRHRDDIDHPSPLAPLISPPLHALLHLHTSPSSRSNAIYDPTTTQKFAAPAQTCRCLDLITGAIGTTGSGREEAWG